MHANYALVVLLDLRDPVCDVLETLFLCYGVHLYIGNIKVAVNWLVLCVDRKSSSTRRTNTTPAAPRNKVAVIVRKRSCPAVSHFAKMQMPYIQLVTSYIMRNRKWTSCISLTKWRAGSVCNGIKGWCGTCSYNL